MQSYTHVAKKSSGSESRVSLSRSCSPMLMCRRVAGRIPVIVTPVLVVAVDGMDGMRGGANACDDPTHTAATITNENKAIIFIMESTICVFGGDWTKALSTSYSLLERVCVGIVLHVVMKLGYMALPCQSTFARHRPVSFWLASPQLRFS